MKKDFKLALNQRMKNVQSPFKVYELFPHKVELKTSVICL